MRETELWVLFGQSGKVPDGVRWGDVVARGETGNGRERGLGSS